MTRGGGGGREKKCSCLRLWIHVTFGPLSFHYLPTPHPNHIPSNPFYQTFLPSIPELRSSLQQSSLERKAPDSLPHINMNASHDLASNRRSLHQKPVYHRSPLLLSPSPPVSEKDEKMFLQCSEQKALHIRYRKGMDHDHPEKV